ncbi:MAG: U32 family peptidase [Candidatus ainarchaeum sp.]|nr:U32 family peptidase [Candidatus ainarchaeum sp.]
MKKIEILVGVGSWESLNAAAQAKADAVYLGLKDFNLRAFAKNFELSELKKIVDFCHKNKMKVYLALNSIVYDNELGKVGKILTEAKKAKIDAIICSDLAVMKLAKARGLPIHVSTQMSISNSLAAQQLEKMFGTERIVLARELSLEKIKEFKKKTKVGIEVFCHGSMCISISGRCFLSLNCFDKSANKGECTQVCRRTFYMKECEESLDVVGNTIFSSKDLCTIEFLDKIVGLGPVALKIEGRTKPAEYVYVVTKVYKSALKDIAEKKFTEKKKKAYLKELETVYNRGFTSGFYFSTPGKESIHTQDASLETESKIYLGNVSNYYAKIGVGELKLQNEAKVGDELQAEGKTTFFRQKVSSIQKDGKNIKVGKKGEKVGFKLKDRVRIKDKLFLIKKSN